MPKSSCVRANNSFAWLRKRHFRRLAPKEGRASTNSKSTTEQMSERDHRASLRALRETNLARLLARRLEGIFVSAFERGEMPGSVPPGLQVRAS